MKSHCLIYLLLVAPLIALAQAAQPALDDLDLSDVVVIDDLGGLESEPSSVSSQIVVEPDASAAEAVAEGDAPDLGAAGTAAVAETPAKEVAPIVPAAAAPEPEAAPAAVPLLDQLDLSDVVVIDDQAGQGAGLESLSSAAPVSGAALPQQAQEAGASMDPIAPDTNGNSALLSPDTEVIFELPVPEAAPAGATLAGPSVGLPASSVEVSSVEAAPQGGAVSEPEEAETISVDFPDEDVRTILRTVADLFDLNLVIPDALQGRTSVKLRKITWQQVFEVVLEPLGFTYLVDRNIIRIKSIAELTTEPVDTRIFVVNYARAGELQASIAPLVDAAAGGRIQVDSRSNALVITERPSRMNKIQNIIERLDKATDQIMIETKFIEVSNADVKDLGVNWASLSGYGVGVGNIQREWSRTRTSSRDNTVSAGSDLSSSTNSTLGTTNSVGSDSSSSIVTSSGSIDGFPNPEIVDSGEDIRSTVSSRSDDAVNSSEDSSTTLSSLAQIASAASTGRLDTAVFSADNFRVVLSALKQMRNSKLKTNPTIVVMDNKKAYLNIGQQYPTRAFEYNAETGQIEPGALNYEPLGVELTVTPSANADGMINLDIEPKVRILAGTIATLNGLQDPLFEEKSVRTSVTIKDGFTLALGGLVEQTSSDQSTAVPVLSKLPGIGRLFKSKSTNVETNNLIIFITAKTLNPDGSTYREVVDPRVLDQMSIEPSELPGYQIEAAAQAQLQQLEAYRAKSKRDEAAAMREARIKAIAKKQRKQAKAKTEATESEKTE